MIRAFTTSMKKPHTSGTTIKARGAAPYCLATAVMLTIAVAVEPSVMFADLGGLFRNWLDASPTEFREMAEGQN